MLAVVLTLDEGVIGVKWVYITKLNANGDV